MSTCEVVQTALDEFGVEHVDAQTALQAHIADCETCQAYRYAATVLEYQLNHLAEHPAPARLTKKVLRSLPKSSEDNCISGRRNAKIGLALAAGFGIVLVSTVITSMYLPIFKMGEVVGDYEEDSSGIFNMFSGGADESAVAEIPLEEKLAAKPDYIPNLPMPSSIAKPENQSGVTKDKPDKKQMLALQDRRDKRYANKRNPYAKSKVFPSPPLERGAKLNQDKDFRENRAMLKLVSPMAAAIDEGAFDNSNDDSKVPQDSPIGRMDKLAKADQTWRPENYSGRTKNEEIRLESEIRMDGYSRDASAEQNRVQTGTRSGKKARQGFIQSNEIGIETDKINKEFARSLEESSNPAQSFFDRLQSLEGLAYQKAQGYWANTYIPGDPSMRLLAQRLKNWDRVAANNILGQQATMDQLAQQYHQPFDPPGRSALAVYLHSDHAAINNPTRMRLQIGLQASKRLSGHRPALNMGIIIDLPDTPQKNQFNQLRTLVDTLKNLKQVGDNFSITVTGAKGGTWVGADDFRHGPIHLAFEKLQSREPFDTQAKSLSLIQAIDQASELVRKNDDPNATLGSSSILLISNRLRWPVDYSQEVMVHNNAVSGITLSAVSLSGSHQILDKLILAGQGNRWLVHNTDMAKEVAHKEVLSSSRAVARAVRLKIRLGKNVKLVEVINSHKLSSQKAQRVREAEQSIDQRLSRNLGIIADRGEDEDGIQIVIPHFYAADSHIILLDVVAAGPGHIADVSIKYKDLLYMRNGTAQAQLQLKKGKNSKGPMQYKVLKNLLAIKMANTIKKAKQKLDRNDKNGAVSLLNELHTLIRSLKDTVTTWRRDPELQQDLLLLEQFIAILDSPLYANNQHRRNLIDALQYSGWRKLVSQQD